MASKAYVASLTLSELKRELKQRGLIAKGTKKDLRDRLEQALDEEELDDPSSESDEEGVSHPLQGTGFNFEVLPESFIKEETPEDEVEPMIVSVELSNKEKLEVYSHKPVETCGQVIGKKSPMIVAIELKSAQVPEEQGNHYSHRNGREAASNMDVQATVQQVETAASESKGEGESGRGSAQGEAAVTMEDEQQINVQQASAPEVKDPLPPQPIEIIPQAPDPCKQHAEVTADVHQEPVKVQEPCVPGEVAPRSVVEEVPKQAASIEEKPSVPNEVACTDTKVGEVHIPKEADDNSHMTDEKMETGEATPPEDNPMPDEVVLPGKMDKESCVLDETTPPNEKSHVPDETTPPDVKMEEPHASDEAKPSAKKSHVPDEAEPSAKKSRVPDKAEPPAEESHVPDEATPPKEKSHVPDEATPPNEKSPVPDEATPPKEKSHVPDEATPPNEKSPVPDEATPPNVKSPVPDEATPPNVKSHIPDEATPPNEKSPVLDEATPPNVKSHILDAPGEKMEEEPYVPDAKSSVSQDLHVPDNPTLPDITDQQSSSAPEQASETNAPQDGHQHQEEEPAQAEEGTDEIPCKKNTTVENVSEVIVPAESVLDEEMQSIEGVPEVDMTEDGQRKQVKELECRGEGEVTRGVEPDTEQQKGSAEPKEGEEAEKAGPGSGEVLAPVEEHITERETANSSVAVVDEEEGTEQNMETVPGAESVGEAECMIEKEGEESVMEPPERMEEEAGPMKEELEHNSVKEKVAQKKVEGERDGNNPSQDEGEDPKPDIAANPANMESVQPEAKCGETKQQRRNPSNQEDPWEESEVAGRAAGGDAGEGDQGVSETTLDSGLELGRVDTSSAQEEVSQLALESGQIDVDVLVHAEEDDLSVFSTEAAEAVALATTRDRSRKAKHSPSSRRNSDYSRKREPVASSRSGKVASQPRKSPPVDSKRQRNDKPEPPYEQPSIKRRRISTQGSSSAADGSVVTGSQERRRRWGSAKQRSGSTSATTISSDVLKDIIPAGLEEEGVGVDVEGGGVGMSTLALDSVMGYGGEEEEEGEVGSEKSSEETARREHQLDTEHQKEWEEAEKEREVKRRAVERARQELETRRRIEARLRAKQEMEEKAKREENVKRRTPSPARNPPSRILHVEHLTRPFTIMQLKDLLTEDGPMISDGFWTNKIKSHCIVLYKSQESAVATRAHIHGIKWPSTNPKLLCADYLTPSDVQRITGGEMVVEAVQEEEEEEEEEEKEIRVESGEEEKMEAEGERGGGEGEEVVPSDTMTTEMREEAPPSSSSSPKRVEKPAVEKEPSPPPAKKEKHKATKLLDELFRKTKTTPSIYWLPLTDAQAKERQDLLRAREEEREKQRQERVRLRQEAREKEEKERREREERERKERERRIREERERRARERMRGRSRSRSRSRSRDRRRR